MKRLAQRIEEKIHDRSSRPVLIVALGDSVTQGVGQVDQLLHRDVYHARLKAMLEQRFSLCTFSVINAGVDGQTAAGGLSRFGRDVTVYQPDLLIIAFGLNDAVVGGEAGIDAYRSSIESLIVQAREHTEADVLLVTPNMLLTRDNDTVAACYRQYVPAMLKVQRNGTLAKYAGVLRSVAAAHGIAVADIYHEWQALADAGVDTTAMLCNGLNHPDAEGHRLAADVMFRTISAELGQECALVKTLNTK